MRVAYITLQICHFFSKNSQMLCKINVICVKRAQICDFDAEIVENMATFEENSHDWRQH